MKGHVRTPPHITDRMVKYLFRDSAPSTGDRILYPGCGSDAPFIQAVIRYCHSNELPIPEGIAFETHPERYKEVQKRHVDKPVEFRNEDFLTDQSDLGKFDYVIGNPPYVPLPDIESADEYRDRFETAQERFDLYVLFFEQALEMLREGGRLVYVTPEKFEYTLTTAPLRRKLASNHVELIEHLSEDTFSEHTTYPTITVVRSSSSGETSIQRRNGTDATVSLPSDGSSWAPLVREVTGDTLDSELTLGEITERISPGMATGRDKVFVQPKEDVPELIDEGWAYPTTSGKQLRINDGPPSNDVILCPYDEEGDLIPESDLGLFGDWAAEFHREELEERACVADGKPWYSWHENPPMDAIIGEPKIVCPDVTEVPRFWADPGGEVLPRHSVYYIVPHDSKDLEELIEYLTSQEARAWLDANCQRASNGYIRLQSNVLQDLPVPERFGATFQTTIS